MCNENIQGSQWIEIPYLRGVLCFTHLSENTTVYHNILFYINLKYYHLGKLITFRPEEWLLTELKYIVNICCHGYGFIVLATGPPQKSDTNY